MANILLINGPNLNLLGTREPELYGHTTLGEIEQDCQETGRSLGLTVQCIQSNHEGEIVDQIQAAQGSMDGIIINPAAYSHTSVAMLDALHAFQGKVVEVHLSNIYQREEFRHHSFVSARADGIIVGLGAEGYRLALQAMKNLL